MRTATFTMVVLELDVRLDEQRHGGRSEDTVAEGGGRGRGRGRESGGTYNAEGQRSLYT